ncbi:MAG: N-acetylmuramoyl-L-alanine amidase [Lachnospiraceae bacterium]|nr:N-acetylmuramoyl-L-alanine amidase [Lachnospiraceae bacterium]
MATYNIHAGHGRSGGQGCGASGILDESTEARYVKAELINLLRESGNTVYDCTYEGNAGQNTILAAIVKNCNKHDVDLDISIHLNSGRNDFSGDGSTGGVEVYGYDNDVKDIGERICMEIASSLDIRNRGFKINKELYVLNKTRAKAILIECCFVDDRDDAKNWNPILCAKAIATCLCGHLNPVSTSHSNTPLPQTSSGQELCVNAFYRVFANGNWYSEVKNLEDYAGVKGETIKSIAIRVDNGSVKYRVHLKNGNWLPYVTGYDISDSINGYAGNNRDDIDCVEVYYFTPPGHAYKKAKYRVAPQGGASYYDWQTDNDKADGMDGYAGAMNVSIDRFQLIIE